MIEVIEKRKDGFESDDSDEGYDDDDDSREKYESSDPTLRLTDEEFSNSKVQRFVSCRKLYGKTEDVYIMDAKSIGNIGRYLNHSCSPNVFSQNVFVDTHDLRFPWIAFFTMSSVKAGAELCWDYNYEVGSIPGKTLYCSCGSDYCRGKLL